MSVRTQILDQAFGLLSGVAGATAYRNRAQAVEREEGVVVNLTPRREVREWGTFGSEHRTLWLDVCVIYAGDIDGGAIDPILDAIDAALIDDHFSIPELKYLRVDETTWQTEDGDAGLVTEITVSYRAEYDV